MKGGMNTQFDRFNDRFKLTPLVVFGQSLVTQQFTLNAVTPVRLIERGNAKMFVIGTIDATQTAFIGNQNVTALSGFAITPELSPIIFGIAENAELWAIGSGAIVIFLLDMGL